MSIVGMVAAALSGAIIGSLLALAAFVPGVRDFLLLAGVAGVAVIVHSIALWMFNPEPR